MMTTVPFSSWMWPVALVAIVVGSSCRWMPLVAPSGTTITLLVAANSVAVNGSTDVTAVLIEGAADDPSRGTPVHDGTVVAFVTTLGRIEPSEAKTSGGRAVVRLIAEGRSGTATITAVSGPASQTLDVSIGAAAAVRLAVTATPQSLPATGGSTTISARVEDQQGNGISGVVVSFSTSAGALASANATTNGDGIATTALVTTQAATVTATASGATSAVTGTVSITLSPRGSVSITAPSGAMVAVPAAFTFTPGPGAVITEVDVDWGDGSGAQLGALSNATTVQHPFRSSGIKTVSVNARDSAGARTETMTQVGVAPLSATGSFTPSSVTEPNVGDPILFTVVVPANALIERFEWAFGDGTGRNTSTGQTSYAYGSPGSKIVSVRVVPIGGGTAATVLMSVEVKP